MGPTAGVLLRAPLNEEQVNELEGWLRANSSGLEGSRLHWPTFWIRDGAPLGMTEDCSVNPCAFGLSA